MSREEKVFLLHLILLDLAKFYKYEVTYRAQKAYDVALELDLGQFLRPLLVLIDSGSVTADVFHYNFEDGGYIGMEKIHGLPFRLSGRSRMFRDEALSVLLSPESSFEDIKV